MAELQKSFLLDRFFNRDSCDKGLKVRMSCFFLFFLIDSPGGGFFYNQKNHFVPDII